MLNLPRVWRRPLLGLVLAWGLIALLYYDTGAAMVDIWNRSGTFAHAWVVPPISAWLVWRRRGDLAVLVPQPGWRWLWLMPPLGLLWVLGELAAGNAPTQFALVGMIVLMVPTLLGSEVARRIAFPLGFLFFAVPFGDFMTPWLIDRTADFTVIALRATGIPLFREGNQFVIPSGSWSVVQACSGIRYMMASVMVGALFAYLNYQSLAKRWAFVGVAVLTPLVANWVRAYMIVMLAHLSRNELAVGVDHLIYGWVFFGIIMLVMFMIGARWAEPDPEPLPAPDTQGGQSPTDARLAAVFLAALLLAAVPSGLRLQLAGAVAHGEPELAAAPIDGWTWKAEPLNDWKPDFQNPAASLHGRYESADGAKVGIYIGYYRHQRYGRQLVTSVNGLFGEEWSRTFSDETTLDGQPWRRTELRGQALSVVSGGGENAPRLRVWQVYWINGQPHTSDWQAKLSGLWQSLLGRGDDAAVVIVYADKAMAGVDDALLRDFLHAHWAKLDTALRGVRDRDAPRQP